MSKILVGDLHGNLNWLPTIHQRFPEAEEIILVGDVGIGFSAEADELLRDYAKALDKPYFRFIRGNHDNPEVVKSFTDPGFKHIPDGTIEDGILYVGGAWSIDGVTGVKGMFSRQRTVGIDWWEDEELSNDEWEAILSNPELSTVHTVISHDCPMELTPYLIPKRSRVYENRTGNWLSTLWENLPGVDRWFFGHYHVRREIELGGVAFRCLAEGETCVYTTKTR